MIQKSRLRQASSVQTVVQYLPQPVVAEHAVAWELANALVEQFYSDRFETFAEEINRQREYARNFNGNHSNPYRFKKL